MDVKSEALDGMISKSIEECNHTYNLFYMYSADTTKTNEIYFDSSIDKNKHQVDLYIGAVCESKFKASITLIGNYIYLKLQEYVESDTVSGCERVIKVTLDIEGNLENKKIRLKEIESANGRLMRFHK